MAEGTKGKDSFGKGILFLLVFGGLIWYFYGGGLEKQSANDLQNIKNEVAVDAVRQYEIAKKNGTAMDAYVNAGLVAAAYLQAKDEVNYKKWKEIEKNEGKNVGINE